MAKLKSGFYYLEPASWVLYLGIIVIGAMLPSCSTSKNTSYFQTIRKDTTLQGFITNDFESKIRKKDVLGINISSLSPAEDAFFNAASASAISSTPAGYFVSDKGTITMHKLGEVQVEGLTRKQLQEKLQKELLPYLKDPIVNVQYLNHKVTVMGEVTGPKIVNMPEEQLPLLDVLVTSGDLKPDALSDKIMIIREDGNKKIIKHVNLQDHSIFSSQWYYLQPNDIVYVSQDIEKKLKQEKRENLQRNIGFVTAGITFIILILDRVTR